MIRAPAGNERIKAIAHHGCRICLSPLCRKLSDHGLYGSSLIKTAVGHEHRPRADRGIKHLNKPLLRCFIQVAHRLKPCLPYILYRNHLTEIGLFLIRHHNPYICLLMSSVCIKEASCKIHYSPASPCHMKSRLLCHYSDLCRLEILLRGISHKLSHVSGFDYHCHPLL